MITTRYPWRLPVTALLAAVFLAPLSAEEPKRYPVPVECMHAENGHCYIASMDFGEEGVKFTGNKSMLVLFEEGKPLGPLRSAHAHIRESGEGRYSHWTRETLYFSASDSTDPRTNGRRYEVASRNARSTLGGLDRFPATPKKHVEEGGRHRAGRVFMWGSHPYVLAARPRFPLPLLSVSANNLPTIRSGWPGHRRAVRLLSDDKNVAYWPSLRRPTRCEADHD